METDLLRWPRSFRSQHLRAGVGPLAAGPMARLQVGQGQATRLWDNSVTGIDCRYLQAANVVQEIGDLRGRNTRLADLSTPTAAHGRFSPTTGQSTASIGGRAPDPSPAPE